LTTWSRPWRGMATRRRSSPNCLVRSRPRSGRCSARRSRRTGLANSRSKCSRRDCRCDLRPFPPGHETTVFLPASCNERAHGADVCDPVCNQSALSCSDLAPTSNPWLQSACARTADVCDPGRGCLQVATRNGLMDNSLARRTAPHGAGAIVSRSSCQARERWRAVVQTSPPKWGKRSLNHRTTAKRFSRVPGMFDSLGVKVPWPT
jgi:hypothetical protein